MYILKNVKVPEGYKYSEYCSYLANEIRENRNKDENMDILFRLTYPKAINDVSCYTNLMSLEDLEGYLPLAFMKTVKNFDPTVGTVSFMGYYHKVLHGDIINGYYGKYKHTPEKRDLKRRVDGTMASMDTPVTDKNGADCGTYEDLIEDYFDIDTELLNTDFKNDIMLAIDRVFNENRKGLNADRIRRPKAMFIDYIMSIVDDEKVTMTSIAEKHGVTKSSFSNIIYKYRGDFKRELYKLGYDL
jgi:DNA-directed RNA polymerase specialized sigma subunit